MREGIIVGDWMENECIVLAGKILEGLNELGLLPPFDDKPDEPLDGIYFSVCDGDGKVVFKGVIGSERDERFAAIAQKKAEMSARERMSTREIIVQGRLRPGDTKWPGGLWFDTLGVAVGVSGIYSRWDEFIAAVIGWAMKVLVRGLVEDQTKDFIPVF